MMRTALRPRRRRRIAFLLRDLEVISQRQLQRVDDVGKSGKYFGVGFFSRMFVPRSVRRVIHPSRALKRAVTPKFVKRARHAMHPVGNAVYGLERSSNTKRRTPLPKAPVYMHGSCPVRHRTPGAAARCRNS